MSTMLKYENFLLSFDTDCQEYSIFINPLYLKNLTLVVDFDTMEGINVETNDLNGRGIGVVNVEENIAFFDMKVPRTPELLELLREISRALGVDGYSLSCLEYEDEMVSPTGFEPVTN